MNSSSHTPLSHHIHTVRQHFAGATDNQRNVNTLVDRQPLDSISTASQHLSQPLSIGDKSVELTKTMVYQSLNNHKSNQIHMNMNGKPTIMESLRARLLKSPFSGQSSSQSPLSSSLSSSSSPSSSSLSSSSSSSSPNDVSSVFLDRLSNEVHQRDSLPYTRDSLTPLFRFHRNATSFSSSVNSPISSMDSLDSMDSSSSLSSPSSSLSFTSSQAAPPAPSSLLSTSDLLTNVTNSVKNNSILVSDPTDSSRDSSSLLLSNSLTDSSSEETDSVASFVSPTTTLSSINLPEFQNEFSNSRVDNGTLFVNSMERKFGDEFFSYSNLPMLIGISAGIIIVIFVLVILLCYFCDLFRRLRNSSDDASYGVRPHSSRSSLTSSEHHSHHHHHCGKHSGVSSLYINNPNSIDLSCHEKIVGQSNASAITRSTSVPGQQQTIYGSQLSKNIVNYYESQQQQQQSTQTPCSKHVEGLSTNNAATNSTNACNGKCSHSVTGGSDSPIGSVSSDILGGKHPYKNTIGGGLLLTDFISEHSLFSDWPSSNDRFSSGSSLISSANDSSTLQRINFSKNRRNRMRNDSAAAIALIKSGVFQHSNTRLKPKDSTGNKDTSAVESVSKANTQHFSDSLFDTWDTIPEVAFGGTSTSGIIPVNTSTLAAVTTGGASTSVTGSVNGSGSGNSNRKRHNSIVNAQQPPQHSSVNSFAGSPPSDPQIKDLSLSVSNDDDENEAVVVYNERTAL